MRGRGVASGWLVHNFQEFYNEVLRKKEVALRTTGGNSPLEILKEETDQTTDLKGHLTEKIQRKLILILEKQSFDAQNQVGDFALSVYQEAQYAMVSLADEVFLTIRWSEQKRWEDNLLESHFYGTQIAGELIFKKLDDLLEADDPMKTDLAKIYLMILGLGFRGQYRNGGSGDKTLDDYRERLFTAVHRKPSSLFNPGRDRLSDEAYDHLLDSVVVRGLPDVRIWMIAFASVIGAYLLTSSVLWYKLARDIDSSIDYILRQAHHMGIS